MNLLLNPLIPIVPYSGRTTGFVKSVLAEWNFVILLTWTSEEGLSLFKEEVVEYDDNDEVMLNVLGCRLTY